MMPAPPSQKVIVTRHGIDAGVRSAPAAQHQSAAEA